MANLTKRSKKRETELYNKYIEAQETTKRLDKALRQALGKHNELNKTVTKLRVIYTKLISFFFVFLRTFVEVQYFMPSEIWGL